MEMIEITSSCDCLRVELLSQLLVPSQQVEGFIELDLRKEPEFTGSLGINVTGRGTKGERVFEMEVHVAVVND